MLTKEERTEVVAETTSRTDALPPALFAADLRQWLQEQERPPVSAPRSAPTARVEPYGWD